MLFDPAKSINLHPLSFEVLCILCIPIAGRHMTSLPTFTLKISISLLGACHTSIAEKLVELFIHTIFPLLSGCVWCVCINKGIIKEFTSYMYRVMSLSNRIETYYCVSCLHKNNETCLKRYWSQIIMCWTQMFTWLNIVKSARKVWVKWTLWLRVQHLIFWV